MIGNENEVMMQALRIVLDNKKARLQKRIGKINNELAELEKAYRQDVANYALKPESLYFEHGYVFTDTSCGALLQCVSRRFSHNELEYNQKVWHEEVVNRKTTMVFVKIDKMPQNHSEATRNYLDWQNEPIYFEYWDKENILIAVPKR